MADERGPVYRVMISSTVRDLPEHREAVQEACLRQGMFPVMMEHLPASSGEAVAVSRAMVEEADVYLGVFAWRYGFVPPDGEKSVTQIEYECAFERGIERLVFFMDKMHPIVVDQVEQGDESRRKLEEFKGRMALENIVKEFRSPDDLKGLAVDALVAAKRKLGASRRSDGPARSEATIHPPTVIPRPPDPYVAHQYTLLNNRRGLIGREAERRALDDWIASSASPDAARVFCATAIGGMGKSALTWTWFHDHAPARFAAAGRPLKGCIWWSFYESDATYENLIVRTLAYVSGIAPGDLVKQYEGSLPEMEDALFAALDREPYLVVLDGLERILNAYADPAALHRNDEDLTEDERERVPRLTMDINAGRFLRKLANLEASRILASTRLFPAALEDPNSRLPVRGTDRLDLGGLRDTDALALWESLGVVGEPGPLLDVFHRFESHPLLIQALAGRVRRTPRARRDFDAWRALNPEFDVFSIPLRQVRTEILAVALQGLSKAERHALHVVAGVRSPLSYETLAALLVGRGARRFRSEAALVSALGQLQNVGLLGWDDRPGVNRYDLHPIVRGVVWSRIDDEDRDGVLDRLQHHFEAMPSRSADEVRTLEDLTPAIELVHALAGRGRYPEADGVFRERLRDQLRKIGAHQAYLAVARRFFPEESGWDGDPRVSAPGDFFLKLGSRFRLVGDLRTAAKFYKRHNETCPDVVCPLHEAGLFHSSGRLLQAHREHCRVLAAIRKGWGETPSLSDPVRSLLRTWPLVASLAHARGDREACRLAEDLVVRALFVRWSSSDFEDFFEYDRAGDTVLRSFSLRMAWRRGRWKKVAHRADLLWKMAEDGGNEPDRIQAALDQGGIARRLGDQAKARERLEYARARAKACTDAGAEASASISLAMLYQGRGEGDLAFAALEDVWDVIVRAPFRLMHADALNVKAAVERDRGDLTSAAESATEAYRQAWCDGPPFAYQRGLDEARAHLAALGVPEPALDPFRPPPGEAVPALDLDVPDEVWAKERERRIEDEEWQRRRRIMLEDWEGRRRTEDFD